MPWLADSDVGVVRRLVRRIAEAPTEVEVRRGALAALRELVPADLVIWDRVDLATGAVDHDAAPAGAEAPGAFDAVVSRAADHPLLAAHAAGRRPALRLGDLVDPDRFGRGDLYGDLLHASGVEYEIAIGMHTRPGSTVVAAMGRTEIAFSERDRDLLDAFSPGLENALQTAEARERYAHAMAAGPPVGTAVVLLNRYGEIELSSRDAERWLLEHFGAPEHAGWPPAAISDWLALPPRPALVSDRDGRRLTVRLLPGDPHALLLEETLTSFRPEALHGLGLSARETEVLRAAAVIVGDREIAWELSLSLHAVREHLAALETKLGVDSASAAVAHALHESA